MRRFTRGPVHRPRAYLMTGTTTRNALRKLRSRRTQRTPRESRRGLVPILRLCAVASVALVGLSIGVWMTRSRTRMPHLDRWRKMLARTQGIAQAERLAARMQARYQVLRAEHPQPRSLALRVHRNHMILPGLAVYVALREEGIAKDTALAEVQSLLFQVPSLLGLTMMLLRYVPGPLRALRWINNVSLLAAFPSDGWDTQIVAATKDLYAFNISRCYYLDVFAEHGAPELTALYCRLDYVAFAQLPASVRWERTTTLGRGGSCCDFRWSRVDVSTAVASRRDTAVCADCHEHRHSGAYPTSRDQEVNDHMSDANGRSEVLIVEDERTVREMLRVSLENAGYHVFEVAGGPAALRTLRHSPCRMVVVVDADLPGASAQAMLTSAVSDARVGRHAFVYLTSVREDQGASAQRDLLAQLGVPVLRTPFTVETLIEVVRHAAHRPLSSTLTGGMAHERSSPGVARRRTEVDSTQ